MKKTLLLAAYLLVAVARFAAAYLPFRHAMDTLHPEVVLGLPFDRWIDFLASNCLIVLLVYMFTSNRNFPSRWVMLALISAVASTALADGLNGRSDFLLRSAVNSVQFVVLIGIVYLVVLFVRRRRRALDLLNVTTVQPSEVDPNVWPPPPYNHEIK